MKTSAMARCTPIDFASANACASCSRISRSVMCRRASVSMRAHLRRAGVRHRDAGGDRAQLARVDHRAVAQVRLGDAHVALVAVHQRAQHALVGILRPRQARPRRGPRVLGHRRETANARRRRRGSRRD
jgi:hypothetical protein